MQKEIVMWSGGVFIVKDKLASSCRFDMQYFVIEDIGCVKCCGSEMLLLESEIFRDFRDHEWGLKLDFWSFFFLGYDIHEISYWDLQKAWKTDPNNIDSVLFFNVFLLALQI